MKKRVSITLAVLGLCASQAYGDTAESNNPQGWMYTTFENEYSSGEMMKSDPQGRAGNVSFSCTQQGLFATVTLSSKDFNDGEAVRVVRRETKRVELFINGVKFKTKRWTYADIVSFTSPTDRKTKAALYNAAIRGDVVTLAFKKQAPLTLILPKPNDAFAKFGAPCGLGRVS